MAVLQLLSMGVIHLTIILEDASSHRGKDNRQQGEFMEERRQSEGFEICLLLLEPAEAEVPLSLSLKLNWWEFMAHFVPLYTKIHCFLKGQEESKIPK